MNRRFHVHYRAYAFRQHPLPPTLAGIYVKIFKNFFTAVVIPGKAFKYPDVASKDTARRGNGSYRKAST